MQCNGVYPFFVRRSFRSSQIVICKNSSLSCFSMRIFELNHLINGMIFSFSKKHLEDHPIDILKKDHFPKKSPNGMIKIQFFSDQNPIPSAAVAF